MDPADLVPMLEELGEHVDELEEALGPLLKGNLANITSKLPLLEKAKLQVLVTYAIESILFSTLKLNGVDAREHVVFTELTRVKQYFEKIKKAEDDGPEQRPNTSLDKAAASRFIKAALSGNDDYDHKRAEQRRRENEQAQIQFEKMSEQVGSTQRFKGLTKKRKADDIPISISSKSSSSSSSSSRASSPSPELEKGNPQAAVNHDELISGNEEIQQTHKKSKKRKKHIQSTEQVGENIAQPQLKEAESLNLPSEKPKKSPKRKHHQHKSDKTPKAGKSVFHDLLNRPSKTKKPQQSE